MRFVHIADMHFDSTFSELDAKAGLGEKRRLEQRNAFKKVINYIKENNIEYFFIAGDLFEYDTIRNSSIKFINDCFKEIPETKIFISPGNHDPFTKNSPYNTFEFCENVYIFKGNIEKIDCGKVNVYGFGFTDFHEEEAVIEKIYIDEPDKTNILVIHADVNGNKDEKGYMYNPISMTDLKAKNFDYVALGHVHKNNIKENQNFVYPGSTISFGFDELEEHGMVVGEINDKKLKIEFIKIDERIFREKEIDITNINAKEELIEKINELNIAEKEMTKLVLVGKRNIAINTKEIEKLIENENILKIKDKTTIAIDIEKMEKEASVKGFFIKELREKYKKYGLTEEELEQALEIGLNAMN